MPDHRSVVRLPPVSSKETAHDAVTASPVPHENPAWPQYASELSNDSRIVSRIDEEAERREEIENGIESSAPTRGQLSHIAARVAERPASPTLAGKSQQFGRIIEPVDVESGLGQEVRVTALPARNVEDP